MKMSIRIIALPLLVSLILMVVGVESMYNRQNDAGWTKLGKYNQRVGPAFMKKYASDEPNVRRLPSGILYTVLEEGTGTRHPARDCQVLIHHAGRDIRGRVFEDTWSKRRPESLIVGGILSSWQHALERMVEGDVWEIVTPPEYAYAHVGVDVDKIGPHETLMFKLKLLKLECDLEKETVEKNWVHPPTIQEEELLKGDL